MTQDPYAHLPHNQAAENNKVPIFNTLAELDLLHSKVLEIGSGTGQHGVFFCQQTSKLNWQLTEHPNNMEYLNAWYQVAQQQGLSNLSTPVSFDISSDYLASESFSASQFNLIYSANVLHIVSKRLAQTLVQKSSDVLSHGQKFVCYGPFKQNGQFTTESNADFDAWLKQQGYGGVNDMSDIELWSQSKLKLIECKSMPANNFLVVYQKQ